MDLITFNKAPSIYDNEVALAWLMCAGCQHGRQPNVKSPLVQQHRHRRLMSAQHDIDKQTARDK